MSVAESNPRWAELSLRVKLSRLLRVAAELLEEEQPIPPALAAKVREVREALGRLGVAHGVTLVNDD